MNSIDRAILTQLQSDGRISNLELATRINLTPTPTSRRVHALERSGAILGYRAIIDPAIVERGFQVLVWVDLVHGTSDAIEIFEQQVRELEDVVEAHRLYGEPDYLLRVRVRDSQAYETLYTERLASLPGVRKARSQIAMKTIKAGGTIPIAQT